MELSTRNQLQGTVRSVRTGTVMAEVVVDVNGQEVVAAITAGSVEQLGLAEGDQVTVGHRLAICMSCDHRVIDGALGAEYLKELRHLLENPALLLV